MKGWALISLVLGIIVLGVVVTHPDSTKLALKAADGSALVFVGLGIIAWERETGRTKRL